MIPSNDDPQRRAAASPSKAITNHLVLNPDQYTPKTLDIYHTTPSAKVGTHYHDLQNFCKV